MTTWSGCTPTVRWSWRTWRSPTSNSTATSPSSPSVPLQTSGPLFGFLLFSCVSSLPSSSGLLSSCLASIFVLCYLSSFVRRKRNNNTNNLLFSVPLKSLLYRFYTPLLSAPLRSSSLLSSPLLSSSLLSSPLLSSFFAEHCILFSIPVCSGSWRACPDCHQQGSHHPIGQFEANQRAHPL